MLLLLLILPSGTVDTNYGQMTVAGKTITITGNPHWTATGMVRADGAVQLIWTEVETQRLAISVYKVIDNRMVGTWGYVGNVKITKSGDLEAEPGAILDDDELAVDDDVIQW